MKSELSQKGLVSFGMPVYNGSDRIRPAIESILAQTDKSIELVISDNASTDNTREICEDYARRDSRVRYVRQQENFGQLKNILRTLEMALGEYYTLAGDDDWWDPDFAKKLKAILDDHSYGVAMGSVMRVYEDGSIRDTVKYSGDLDVSKKGYGKIFEMMFSEKPIHWFCYLFRTEILRNLFTVPFPNCKSQDRVVMCELALMTRFYSVPDILHKKTVYKKTVEERYANEAMGMAFKNPKKQSKYVWEILKRVWLSKNIFFWRKIRYLPIGSFKLVWQNRVLLREWSPRLLDFFISFRRMLKI